MPGNNDPIWSKQGDIQGIGVTVANTSSQGGGTIGTDIFKAFEADATNGGYVRELRWSLTSTVMGTGSTATVGRVFISSVTSGATTSSNTHLWQEVALAAQTPSSVLPGVPIVVPLDFALPPGYTILVTNNALPTTNTQWKAVVVGGKY